MTTTDLRGRPSVGYVVLIVVGILVLLLDSVSARTPHDRVVREGRGRGGSHRAVELRRRTSHPVASSIEAPFFSPLVQAVAPAETAASFALPLSDSSSPSIIVGTPVEHVRLREGTRTRVVSVTTQVIGWTGHDRSSGGSGSDGGSGEGYGSERGGSESRRTRRIETELSITEEDRDIGRGRIRRKICEVTTIREYSSRRRHPRIRVNHRCRDVILDSSFSNHLHRNEHDGSNTHGRNEKIQHGDSHGESGFGIDSPFFKTIDSGTDQSSFSTATTTDVAGSTATQVDVGHSGIGSTLVSISSVAETSTSIVDATSTSTSTPSPLDTSPPSSTLAVSSQSIDSSSPPPISGTIVSSPTSIDSTVLSSIDPNPTPSPSSSLDSTTPSTPTPAPTGPSIAVSTFLPSSVDASSTSGNIIASDTAAQTPVPSPASAFVLPGRSLSVLPIGLGVFAGIAVLALIIVGVVTYERKKYRRQFRQRKMAEQITNRAGPFRDDRGMSQTHL